jgi:Vault protein inter-alpha-trypsin domain
MPSITMQPGSDPVSQAIASSALMAGARPVPLVSTAYDIDIRGGLAEVAAVRTFRNDEEESIEATLTFPLPVHAVLYSLEACISGRTLKAVARAKATARQTYEDAIEAGKSTVLHEELVKGVHLLSVGHIAPGSEIVVTARFAVVLARVENRILLHIPTTVGNIYGQSGLPDSDELCHGGGAQAADLKVAGEAGEVLLLGGQLIDGKARISLDAPIHLEVKGWRARQLQGRAADGRSVTLTIDPAPAGDRLLSAAILIDRSGSMSELCAASAGLTKHAAVLLGLSAVFSHYLFMIV